MKLQRSTIGLVATALVLGGGVLFNQGRQSNPERAAPAPDAAGPIFEFEEAEVIRLHIETAGQEVTFSRDQDGFWQMTNPMPHPADEAAIAFLLSRLTSDGLVQTTTIDAANQAEFGLDVPFATVALALADGSTHSLVLGAADFSGQNYYALIDPETVPLSSEAGSVTAAIVSENILNGVDRPLDEWQAVVEGDVPADAPENDAGEDTEDSELPLSSPSETAPSPVPPETSDPPESP